MTPARRTALWTAAALCALGALTTPALVGVALNRRALALVSEGEASAWHETLHAALRVSFGPPSDEMLGEILRENADDGLRFVALLDREGGLIASAGVAFDTPLCDERAARVQPLGDRVRLCDGPLPPRHHPMDGPPHPTPRLVLEFVPERADEFARAQRLQGLSVLAALLAALASGALALKLSRERAALHDAVERSRHLSSLGEMSAVLAHEIRNPLASLKGHAQLLEEAVAGDAKLTARAGRVVKETVRLEALVTELLAFARHGVIARRAVRPEALARDVIASLDADAVDLVLTRCPESFSLDPELMTRCLENVLRNALEAQGAGERATLTATVHDASLVFEIRDRGPGITPGTESEIFEPFRTQKVRGTGLGLAIARRAVELHGGTIAAYNHPGGGAVFRVVIPEE